MRLKGPLTTTFIVMPQTTVSCNVSSLHCIFCLLLTLVNWAFLMIKSTNLCLQQPALLLLAEAHAMFDSLHATAQNPNLLQIRSTQ